MADERWLQRRGKTWFAVKEVPRPLRGKLGRRFVRSLRTTNLSTAQARRYEALAAFQERIAAAAKSVSPDPIVAAGMEWRGVLQGVARGDARQVKAFGGDPKEAMETARLALWDAAADVETLHDRETAATFEAIAYGHVTPLLHHLEAFLREGGRHGPLSLRVIAQYRTAVRKLEEWAKARAITPTVENITREAAGAYVGALLAAGVHRGTINRHIAAASSYWRWLVKRGHAKENPWREQTLAASRAGNGERPKRPYTDAEIAVLLSGPADVETADAMRLAALSGLRMEELYRLAVEDCSGGWLRIRQAKTAAGVRRVPVHSALTEIVERRCAGRAPNEFLMNEAGAGKPGRPRSAPFSQKFARYRVSRGIDDHTGGQRISRVDFHSFRRWFVTKARNAGIDRATVAAVVGHEVGNLTDDVYSGGPSEEQLRACVEAVELPCR